MTAPANPDMEFSVIFAPKAEAQLLMLYRYIAREASPPIAERFIGNIVDHCEKLTNFPAKGSPRDDVRPGLRTVVFRRRVTTAYTVNGQQILILGIYYGGQDFASLLANDEPD